MKNYKIILKTAGQISQLPDSQKIFGTLITAVARKIGDEKTANFVRSVYNKEVHLAFSNIFPLDYFPVPLDYIVEQLASKTPEWESLKEQRAEIKKRAYVKVSDLNSIIKRPEMCSNLFPYVKASYGQQLRAHVESVDYGIEGLETKLYTVPTLVLQEVTDLKTTNPITEFWFFMQGEEGELLASVLEMLEKLIISEETLVLGKRASQGLNRYRIIDVDQIELPKIHSRTYLNLGMLLPDRVDFRLSTLKLFTSERRPFAMAGGWNQKSEKWFVSFIDNGSIVVLNDGIKHAGRCVTSPYNEARDIVFGNSFLYPVALQEVDKNEKNFL